MGVPPPTPARTDRPTSGQTGIRKFSLAALNRVRVRDPSLISACSFEPREGERSVADFRWTRIYVGEGEIHRQFSCTGLYTWMWEIHLQFPRGQTDRQADRQRDRQTKTDRQTGQTDKQYKQIFAVHVYTYIRMRSELVKRETGFKKKHVQQSISKS